MKSFASEMSCRIMVYEKPTAILAWLLGGEAFRELLDLLQREKRLSYRVLKRRLGVDDDELEDLKEDLIYAKKLAVDEAGRVLVWTGAATAEPPATPPGRAPDQDPLAYTPAHLTEKILASRAALEG